jgi:glycosyltransferase involved in cell wall biosynthesis
MKPWLIVTGDFVTTGGMDVANYALASHLARAGHEVHLVAHRVADDLLALPNVHWHEARKPLNSYYLGRKYLDRLGRKWAAKIAGRGGRVVVNGGNCQWGDVNWVHYVHAAYAPAVVGSAARRLAHAWKRSAFLAEERAALAAARVVVTASQVTRHDLTRHLDVPEAKIRTVYYGTDPQRNRPATAAERAATRARLGWPAHTPVGLFVGALGDRRKGFDTVFDAWRMLQWRQAGDVRLVVIGRGGEMPAWQERVNRADLAPKIGFLGFRDDVPEIVRAADLLVAPARYEPYGLGVHEALCSGVPAITTQTAGVAEKYPPELRDLLLEDASDDGALADRIVRWLSDRARLRAVTLGLAQELRRWTWDDMAAAVVRAAEGQTTGPEVLKLSA